LGKWVGVLITDQIEAPKPTVESQPIPIPEPTPATESVSDPFLDIVALSDELTLDTELVPFDAPETTTDPEPEPEPEPEPDADLGDEPGSDETADDGVGESPNTPPKRRTRRTRKKT